MKTKCRQNRKNVVVGMVNFYLFTSTQQLRGLRLCKMERRRAFSVLLNLLDPVSACAFFCSSYILTYLCSSSVWKRVRHFFLLFSYHLRDNFYNKLSNPFSHGRHISPNLRESFRLSVDDICTVVHRTCIDLNLNKSLQNG